MNLDTRWYLDVNDLAQHTAWAHGFMAAYADWAGLVALAILLVVGWWRARYHRHASRQVATAVVTGIATIVAVVVNQQLISGAIGRSRPCRTLDQAEALVACDGDSSLPSDHCIIAGAFVLGLLVLHRGIGTLAAILALFLAFGRVYVGVHYPLDAITGLVGGALICALLMLVLRRAATWAAVQLTRTPLRPLISARTVPEGRAAERTGRHASTR